MTALEDAPPAELDEPPPEPPPPDEFDHADAPKRHIREEDHPHEPDPQAEDEPAWVNGDGGLPLHG